MAAQQQLPPFSTALYALSPATEARLIAHCLELGDKPHEVVDDALNLHLDLVERHYREELVFPKVERGYE
jgi:hypothetical protein